MSRLAAIRDRWSKATPGPWWVGHGWEQGDPGIYVCSAERVIVCDDTEPTAENALAIAAAPDDVAWLLEVAQLAQIVADLVRKDAQPRTALAALRAALSKGADHG